MLLLKHIGFPDRETGTESPAAFFKEQLHPKEVFRYLTSGGDGLDRAQQITRRRFPESADTVHRSFRAATEEFSDRTRRAIRIHVQDDPRVTENLIRGIFELPEVYEDLYDSVLELNRAHGVEQTPVTVEMIRDLSVDLKQVMLINGLLFADDLAGDEGEEHLEDNIRTLIDFHGLTPAQIKVMAEAVRRSPILTSNEALSQYDDTDLVRNVVSGVYANFQFLEMMS